MEAEDTDVDFQHMRCSGNRKPRQNVKLVLGHLPIEESPVSFKKYLVHIKTEYRYR